jgi:hypothetical protein
LSLAMPGASPVDRAASDGLPVSVASGAQQEVMAVKIRSLNGGGRP